MSDPCEWTLNLISNNNEDETQLTIEDYLLVSSIVCVIT